MKKLFAASLVIAIIAVALLPCAAFAETSAEREICELALADQRIEKCSCVVYRRNCLIAIKCNFACKTDRDEFVENLESQIKEKWQIDNVFVAGSPKLMQAIDRINKLPEDEKDKLIAKLLEQFEK